MAIRTLSSVIEQHIAGLPGLIAVLIGRATDGATVAKVTYVSDIDGKPLLPPVQDTTASTAQALMSYAKRYAPDPNFVMLRLSLKTGIDRIRLEKGTLNPQELRILHKAVSEVLGVERLPIALPS
jgi:hypothetical protein